MRIRLFSDAARSRRLATLLLGALWLCGAAWAETPAADAADCRAPASGTLALPELRALALRCNPALRLARAAELESEADIAIAAQRPNPVLSVGVENINLRAGVGPGGLDRKAVDSVLRVDQQIETGGKAPLRVAAARADREAAGAETGAATVEQLLRLEHAFYDAVIGEQRVAALEQALALYQRSAELGSKRLRAGDIARADLTRIELDGLRAQAELREARIQHNEELAELARQAGLQGTLDRVALSVRWPEGALPALPDEAALMAGALASRPDIAAAEARLRAAAAAREVARAGRVPDITVGAQVERYPTSGGNQQGSGNSFGVFVSIPLMVRHRNDGELQRAEASYYTALETRNRALLEAGNEISRLRVALDAAAHAWRQMREALLPAAEQVAADAELAYARGATGVLDLLDARRALRQAQLDAIAARGAYAKALSAYLAAANPDAFLSPVAPPAPPSVPPSGPPSASASAVLTGPARPSASSDHLTHALAADAFAR